jgi:hypothetical protein
VDARYGPRAYRRTGPELIAAGPGTGSGGSGGTPGSGIGSGGSGGGWGGGIGSGGRGGGAGCGPGPGGCGGIDDGPGTGAGTTRAGITGAGTTENGACVFITEPFLGEWPASTTVPRNGPLNMPP